MKTYVHAETCIRTFLAALVKTEQEAPKRPSTDEQIKNCDTMEYDSAIKME